jgi:hypothetical protein
VHGSEASAQTTRGFPIDAAGRQVIRLRVKGPETARYCVELGGKAFPTTGSGCPAPSSGSAGAAPAAAGGAAAGGVKVTASGRDRARRVALRAAPARRRRPVLRLRQRGHPLRGRAHPRRGRGRLAQSQRPVAIEGHTDAKGADDYNQRLSEDRASSVKAYLAAHGTSARRGSPRWVGGSESRSRPIRLLTAATIRSGRQKNRRVEIVIDTCA